MLTSILPHISGFMSWLGSLSIIVDVVRKYRARGNTNSKPMTYHRLMLGMSLCDMCASGAWMMSTWPVPADTPNSYATHGTEASCRTQAFFIQMGIGVPFYNLFLAIYFWMMISKNSRTSLAVEKCMHFVSFSFALGTAISALTLDLFGYATFWCWIRGEYGVFRWVFWYGPLWVIIATIILIMSFIYNDLRRQENRQQRWSGTTTEVTRSRTVRTSVRRGVSWLGGSPSMHFGSVDHSIDGTDQQTGTHGTTTSQNDANMPRQSSQTIARSVSSVSTGVSDSVKWQSFRYVGSFFLTWIFLTIIRGMQVTGNGGKIPYWILLAGVTLCPSQGFFNFMVYIRPRYKQHRLRHPEVGRFVAFLRVHPFFITCKCKGGLARRFSGSSVGLLHNMLARDPVVDAGRNKDGGNIARKSNAILEKVSERSNENDGNAADSDASISIHCSSQNEQFGYGEHVTLESALGAGEGDANDEREEALGPNSNGYDSQEEQLESGEHVTLESWLGKVKDDANDHWEEAPGSNSNRSDSQEEQLESGEHVTLESWLGVVEDDTNDEQEEAPGPNSNGCDSQEEQLESGEHIMLEPALGVVEDDANDEREEAPGPNSNGCDSQEEELESDENIMLELASGVDEDDANDEREEPGPNSNGCDSQEEELESGEHIMLEPVLGVVEDDANGEQEEAPGPNSNGLDMNGP